MKVMLYHVIAEKCFRILDELHDGYIEAANLLGAEDLPELGSQGTETVVVVGSP